MPPIFIAWTRSFWLGIVPLLMVGADMLAALSDAGGIGPVAALIAGLTGWDAAQVESALRGVAVVAGVIIAQQRSGSARPYTLDPRARE